MPIQSLHVKDTGAQYSSPSDNSDSSSSDSDSDIEGTKNITVAKRYINRHSISSEDLYTNPTPPNKRFRTSTPDSLERRPAKEPIRCPLKEIVNHRPALQIPPVNIVAAPGTQAANAHNADYSELTPWQVEVEMPIKLPTKHCRGLIQL